MHDEVENLGLLVRSSRGLGSAHGLDLALVELLAVGDGEPISALTLLPDA